ncbi:unnamed protein product [Allacma fusca]|uniref:RING-type E3 ubiquitin transferase n=1 Tax=Allacma fusca TaxID=39272 RepID=A0A8J2J1Y1_9HEXA|nr:unnamed protein product [Allacma fusca]
MASNLLNNNGSNNCSCPTQQNVDSFNSCPICLLKFNPGSRIPVGFNMTHNVICAKCLHQLHPNQSSITNLPLLVFLGVTIDGIPLGSAKDQAVSLACRASVENLVSLAAVAKARNVSRAISKKVSNLLVWLTPVTQKKLISLGKSLGNRVLLELISQCQFSNYRAQQQLWSAIRARSCQFMGPALQDEALKLILLALEDGSALSRKVLIMFVVQRLNPQFPQASKTSIGHVIQLLYRSGCFQFIKQDQEQETNLMTLKEEYRNYEAIRREHDTQIIKIGLDSGLHFTPDHWSHILYGDSLHKSLMQSILDKLTEPQSFQQLTTEFLIAIQRLQVPETAQMLIDVHPCFVQLAAIDLNTVEGSWEEVDTVTALLLKTLEVLISQKKSTVHNSKRQKPPSDNQVAMYSFNSTEEKY